MSAGNLGQWHSEWITAPGVDAYAVTPSDSTNFSAPFRGVYVGGSGNIVIVTLGGNAVTFVGVAAGIILPVCGIRINNTNTTATSMVALV